MAEQHSTQYIEGLLVGIQANQTRTEVWLQKFEEGHKKDLASINESLEEEVKALQARMALIEERMTHDSAKRAAWNQLIGAVVAALGIATTFFSGAFNHLFGK